MQIRLSVFLCFLVTTNVMKAEGDYIEVKGKRQGVRNDQTNFMDVDGKRYHLEKQKPKPKPKQTPPTNGYKSTSADSSNGALKTENFVGATAEFPPATELSTPSSSQSNAGIAKKAMEKLGTLRKTMQEKKEFMTEIENDL